MSGAIFGAVDADVLEVVDAELQPKPDLSIGRSVHRDLPAAGARLADDGRALFGGHPIDEEHLDDVHSLVDELPRLRAGIGRVGDRQELRSGRRLPRPQLGERRASGIERGTRQFAAGDPLLDGENRRRRRRQVAHAGHAAHEHLPRRGGNRDALEVGRVAKLPADVGMAVVDQVHVQVPEAGQHRHALCRDAFVASGHRQCVHRSDALDPAAA